MKSTKIMLSGIMLMLLSVFALLADMGNGSWLGGTAVVLAPISLILFAVGLFTKEKE